MVKTIDRFQVFGEVPADIIKDAELAIGRIPESVFPREHSAGVGAEFDQQLLAGLRGQGWDDAEIDSRPFGKGTFTVDVGCKSRKVLVEIEKGRLPRLELDLLKLSAAAKLPGSDWRWGLIVVPASFIRLKLSGNRTPYDHMKSLTRIAAPALEGTLKGLAVIGYRDPRDTGG